MTRNAKFLIMKFVITFNMLSLYLGASTYIYRYRDDPEFIGSPTQITFVMAALIIAGVTWLLFFDWLRSGLPWVSVVKIDEEGIHVD